MQERSQPHVGALFKANVDKVKADTELVRANTANLYIQAEVISSDEVRSALAQTDEFDIETMLDDMEDDENLMTSIHDPVSDPDGGEGEENSGADVTDNTDPTAPDATKNPAENEKASLPINPKRSDGNDYDDFPEYGMWLEEHMEATREEQKAAEEHYKALKKAGNRQHSNRDNQSTKEQKTGGVGVIVVKDGKILCGKRHNDTGYTSNTTQPKYEPWRKEMQERPVTPTNNEQTRNDEVAFETAGRTY